MVNLFKKLFKAISNHRIATGIIIIVVLAGAYFGYNALKGNTSQTRYVLAAAQKGTLIISVSGSGQVSVSDQIDIKPKASGEITSLNIKKGQEIKASTLIAQIDSRDAQKAVRDAKTALETARLEMEELLSPTDELALFQAENSLDQAKKTKEKTEKDLKKTYEDGFNTVANAFLELPGIITGLNDMLFSNTLRAGQWNIDFYADAAKAYDEKTIQYRNDSYDAYNVARDSYDKSFANYKSTSRFSSDPVIENLIDETYETTKLIAEAVKNTNNLIQFYKDKLTEQNQKTSSLADTHLSSLNGYTGKTNTYLLSLLSAKNTIQNDKEAIVDAEQSIKEKELSLAKTKAGADDLSIRAKKIAIQQKEDALLSAQQALADYYVYAPFGGVIAEVDAKKGDSVSSGTAIATLITKQKIAEISLNEVDVAKVKIGQKTTLTFDAIEDLSISGQVADIDALGTITQGVVSYNVKISFDTQDERVKPGMSVSAAIITQTKQDVLLVPNSAIKTSGGQSYVETLEQSQTQLSASGQTGVTALVSPQAVTVETGLANDSQTEIISGLKENDQVITQTIAANSTTQTQSQSSSQIRIPGFGGGQ